MAPPLLEQVQAGCSARQRMHINAHEPTADAVAVVHHEYARAVLLEPLAELGAPVENRAHRHNNEHGLDSELRPYGEGHVNEGNDLGPIDRARYGGNANLERFPKPHRMRQNAAAIQIDGAVPHKLDA